MKCCLNCGKDIPNDSRFCPFCGNSFTETHEEALCLNCGKRIPDGFEYCKYCGTKKGTNPNLKHCPKCNSIVPDDSEYCPHCGKKIISKAKKKKRRIASIIIIVIVVLLVTPTIVCLAERRILKDKLSQAEHLADNREFSIAYSKLTEFEEISDNLEFFERFNILNLFIEIEKEEYDYHLLEKYINAGIYYEAEQYTIARYMFNDLGDYRESRALAKESQINALTK